MHYFYKYKYINGNYIVIIDENDNKIYKLLRSNEDPVSVFPDSIDLKITNKCNIGCYFCHENSNPSGKKFNLDNTIKILDKLPKVGIEIAIGGGDIITCKEDFIKLKKWLYSNKFLPRVTINCKSFKDIEEMDLLDITSGIPTGISISNYEEVLNNISTLSSISIIGGNLVLHIIAGLFPMDDLIKLIERNDINYSILVLGYKNFGRAKGIKSTYSIEEWGRELKSILYKFRYCKNNPPIISFDNLALSQLGIKDSLLEEEWDKLYMGNEFSHTMYVDAVNETFAPTSTSNNRTPWVDYSYNILDYFNKNKLSHYE